MASIVTSFSRNAFQTSFDQLVRKMPWGYDWTSVRLGLWCNWATATTATGGLALGVCEDLRGNSVAVGSTSDVVASHWGGLFFSSTYAPVAGTMSYRSEPAVKAFSNYRGTLWQTGGIIDDFPGDLAVYMAASAAARNAWFVEITKVSDTSYAVDSWVYNQLAAALTDISESTYETWLASPSTTGVLVKNSNSVVVTYGGANQMDTMYVHAQLFSGTFNVYRMDAIRVS